MRKNGNTTKNEYALKKKLSQRKRGQKKKTVKKEDAEKCKNCEKDDVVKKLLYWKFGQNGRIIKMELEHGSLCTEAVLLLLIVVYLYNLCTPL